MSADKNANGGESSRLYIVLEGNVDWDLDGANARYLVQNKELWHDGSLTWSYEHPDGRTYDLRLRPGTVVLRLDGKILDAVWTGEIPVLWEERVVAVHRSDLGEISSRAPAGGE